MLYGLKQVMLTLLLTSVQVSKSVVKLTVPFCVYSVTSTTLVAPLASAVRLNKLLAKESLMLACAFAIPKLFVLFVILTLKNHLTVRLFISIGVSGLLGISATLDLLKLTFVNVRSVAFAVKITS